jgi:regulator of chromosome condensation
MPPKRAAAATAAAVSSRPLRKRAAADEAEDTSASKRPRRAVAAAATTKPLAKKSLAPSGPARRGSNAVTTAKKVAPARKTVPPARKKALPRRPLKKPTGKVEVVIEKVEKPKAPRVPKPKVPALNPLISVAPPRTYPLHAFVFGNGDAGEFGLGVDVLSEIGRPKIHTWVEEVIKDKKYGGNGLENIVAGGMHTLAVTTDGQVRLVYITL